MDRASATKTVDSGSILSRVKPKTLEIGIHRSPAGRSEMWDIVKPPPRVVDRWALGRWQLDSKTERSLRLDNLVNKDLITIINYLAIALRVLIDSLLSSHYVPDLKWKISLKLFLIIAGEVRPIVLISKYSLS